MTIVDVTPDSHTAIEQIAAMMVDGFRDTGSAAWQTLDAGLAEVRESLEPGRISRMALDAAGDVEGWIGGIETYEGHVWELHPLVVRRDRRRQGIGRRLVADFEEQVARRGGKTIMLGTDDENGRTSIAGVDLFPGVLEKLHAMEDRSGHPFAFYRRLGFEVVGVIPDANGFGKPDILMAKRV